MNIIVACTLLVCLLEPSSAVRLRENSNVLVPSNDENLHVKVKKLLNGDEVDPEDFSDNEIQRLSEIKFPKVEMLRNHRNSQTANKVFDDKNKNNEANQIDHDSDELLSTFSDDVISLDSSNNEIVPNSVVPTGWTTPYFNETTSSSTDSPTNSSSPSYVSPTADQTTTNSSISSFHPSSSWSPTDHNFTTAEVTRPWSTTGTNASTPYPTIPFSTPSSTTTEAATTTAPVNETTPAVNITIPTTYEATSTSPSIIESSTVHNKPETLFKEDCLLRKTENYLEWLKSDGTLNVDFIIRLSCLKMDLFISAAHFNQNLNVTLDKVKEKNSTLKYLSLTGHDFSGMELPHLPVLLELDLRSCNLRLVPRKISNFSSLQKLFLSNNHIAVLTSQLLPQSLRLLDLSNNSVEIIIQKDSFKNLKHLQILDLSFARINISDANATKNALQSGSLTGISLCYTNVDLQELNLNFTDSLKKLDLSGLFIDRPTFVHLPTSLEAFRARNSGVHDLGWIEKLENIKFLDLSENDIKSWFTRKFNEAHTLKFLDLSDNNLDSITQNMEKDLMNIQHIAIGNNDFKCDCDLQNFMRILFENTNAKEIIADQVVSNESSSEECLNFPAEESIQVPLGVRNQVRPQYDVMSRTYQKYYDLVKISVNTMNADNPKVLQQSSPRSLIMKSSLNRGSRSSGSGRTVLFDYSNETYFCFNEEEKKVMMEMDLTSCIDEQVDDVHSKTNKSLLALWISFPVVILTSVLIIVVYWKWWYIRYFLVLFKNTAILTFMDDSDGGKEAIIKENGDNIVEIYLYDVFVSYSDHNRQWVLEEFIPNVERRETINVCLHERDFQVGCGILENIVSCMDRSRCLLLLISENFLLSQWCQFEMNLAQHRLLETRREKLIVVLLEDIPARKQPRTLKYLMRTKTYIKWPVNGTSDDKQVFWKRLKKAIISSQWENDNYGSIA